MEEVEEVEERGGSRGGGERRRWRRRREAKAEKKVEKRGGGRGERWRWSNVVEQLFRCWDREVCTPRTTMWGIAHGGRRRRYPTCWTSTGTLGRPNIRSQL